MTIFKLPYGGRCIVSSYSKVVSGFEPGIFQNSAGYVWDTAKSSFYRHQYGWWGKKNVKSRNTYVGSFSEASLEQSVTHLEFPQWRRGSVLHPGTFGLSMETTPLEYSDIYNRALDKLNAKARGDLDLSVDLAELKQTKRMLSAVDQLETYTRLTASRSPRGKAFGSLKYPAHLWLTYTYGIRPLLGTIFGAQKEIQGLLRNEMDHLKVTASGTEDSPKVQLYTYSGGYTYPLSTAGKFKRSVTIGASLYNQNFDITRFTSLNPASVAWELMPYSFVVDWFVDVGGYLRNLETSLLYGNRFSTGYVTDLQVLSCVITDSRKSDSYLTTYTGTARSVSIARSVLNSYPVPLLPTFKADLGSSRLLSAASLLAGFLPNRRSV